MSLNLLNKKYPVSFGFLEENLNSPTAKITSSEFEASYKVLDYSGAFELKDFEDNALVVGDEVTLTVITKQSGTYIGSGTFIYGDNLVTETPIISDLGFDNFLKPFFTGNLTNGGTFVFDKYGAVSSWNNTNGTLAGIGLGEDWIVSIKAKDVSENASSVNSDNTALFNKADRYLYAFLFAGFDGTQYARAYDYNIALPDSINSWLSDELQFIWQGVIQPNIVSDGTGKYFMKSYSPTSPINIMELDGVMTGFSDFNIPNLEASLKMEQTRHMNITSPRGITSVNFATQQIGSQVYVRDNAHEAEFLEIWQSNTPFQDPLLGTRVLNQPSPANAGNYNAIYDLSNSEGIYNIRIRHLNGGNETVFNQSQIIRYSI